MIERYQRFFQLDVFHSYFQKDICRCLALVATHDTEQIIKRFRFTIRRQLNGIGLYAPVAQDLQQLFNYITQATGQDSFCFELRTNDPDFNFFTEVPADWVGQLLYDSKHCTVSDDEVILSQQLSGNPGTLCLGKVTLYFADIMRFSASNGFANFKIQYQARATQWQYFVINRSAVPLSNPMITGKEPIDFEGPENVLMPTGQAALLFSSGQYLIPLSEEVKYKFDLVNRSNSNDSNDTSEEMIVKGLPTPQPAWIGRVTGNANEKLASPMYVYI